MREIKSVEIISDRLVKNLPREFSPHMGTVSEVRHCIPLIYLDEVTDPVHVHTYPKEFFQEPGHRQCSGCKESCGVPKHCECFAVHIRFRAGCGYDPLEIRFFGKEKAEGVVNFLRECLTQFHIRSFQSEPAFTQPLRKEVA